MWDVILGSTLAAILLALLWLGSRLAGLRNRIEDQTGALDRVRTRLAALEQQIDGYWRGVEDRIGKIHDTFESGRACRVGASIAEVDLQMGRLNRKMNELLAEFPRAGNDGRKDDSTSSG